MCEIPLRVTRWQARVLNARFEAARQMYNALLGEAMRRLRLMRQSRLYSTARVIDSTDKERLAERRGLFQSARTEYGFSEYSLSQYATKLRKSWLGDHLDAHVAQKLCKRAFGATEKVMFGRAKHVRFKGKRGLHSVEGKSNETGIRWRVDHVEWSGLNLPMVKGSGKDPVIAHGLLQRVKYVRLIRREIRGKDRFYAQLVCEGLAYQKPDQVVHSGTVGLDIGPSTIAVYSGHEALLEQFCQPIVEDQKYIRRLQRHLDRQRRANNPECFDERGRAIKGKHPRNKSRRQRATEIILREYKRRQAAYRKTLHGKLANRILSLGNDIRTEDVSYKAWQKMFGRSIGLRAPSSFIAILKRKAESAGGQVVEFNTRSTALSQVCLCGQKHKKPLKLRIHDCSCGITMQRDLFSAYLASFVESNRLQVITANDSWSGAEPLLRAAWKQATQNQPASGRAMPSSFGNNRSQSGSPEKEDRAVHEALDAVGITVESQREWIGTGL
ncbi:transposase [Alicyclobacillus dauci]|uniref:Transposase n=1 Tax=Alicyclobacillus dauci TaxID=1475485 RepID=A0ABY6Z8V4_9BACL|nr:transposase [Alicyclobacillus dauci]WAH39315.1 transposase [Alicyclobacillus dauci]